MIRARICNVGKVPALLDENGTIIHSKTIFTADCIINSEYQTDVSRIFKDGYYATNQDGKGVWSPSEMSVSGNGWVSNKKMCIFDDENCTVFHIGDAVKCPKFVLKDRYMTAWQKSQVNINGGDVQFVNQ